jgi:hypothetical protein
MIRLRECGFESGASQRREIAAESAPDYLYLVVEESPMYLHLLLAFCVAPQHQQTPVRVFLGASGDTSIAVQPKVVAQLLDLAYDPRTQFLYTYGQHAGAYRVTQWSKSGRGLSHWDVSSSLTPASILYVRDNELRAVMEDRRRDKHVEVTFGQDSGAPRITDLPADVSAYDASLDRHTHETIRELMKTLNLVPSPILGQHVGNPRVNIDLFWVNARDVSWDKIAWTEDFSVIAFGWDSVVMKLAVKGPDGEYRAGGVEGQVRTAVGAGPVGEGWVELLAVAVSNGAAAYGVEVGRGRSARKYVLWVDVTSRDWRVSRREGGVLARPLGRF